LPLILTWTQYYDFEIYNYCISLERFIQSRRNYFCFQNALGYSPRYTFLQRHPHCIQTVCFKISQDYLYKSLPIGNLEPFFPTVPTIVAGWHIFKTKIPIWVNFGRSCNGKYWYFNGHFGLFHGQIVYFMSILYILWWFGIFFPFW
jgi:hypothetical protein